MSTGDKISPFQLTALIIGSRIMLTYTYLPTMIYPPANQDGWIASILAAVLLVIMALPMLYVIKQYKGNTNIDTVKELFGKPLGITASLIFVVLTLFCYVSCIILDITFLKSAIFPETPTWGFVIYIVIPIAYTAYRGVGTIGRMGVLIVFYIITTIIFYFLASLGDMDFSNLQPVLAESTFSELLKGAFMNASTKAEIFFLYTLGYFLSDKTKYTRILLADVTTSLILQLMMIIPTVSILGVELTKHAANPYFLFTKQIAAYDFIQRVESLNVLAWFLGSLLRSSVFCFMGSYVLSSIFKTKRKNAFVIPFSVLVGIVLLIPTVISSGTLAKLTSPNLMPWIIFPFGFAIPFLMAVSCFIRKVIKKRKKTQNAG